MPITNLADERLLRRFPEAATLAVLDAALVASAVALRVEHPTLDEVPFDPEYDLAPSLLIAYLILARADELRDLLQLYSAAVQRPIRPVPESDDENYF